MSVIAPDLMKLRKVLSQVVVCPDNCHACRAQAQQLLLCLDVLPLETCVVCGGQWSPELGPCPCVERAVEPGPGQAYGHRRPLATASTYSLEASEAWHEAGLAIAKARAEMEQWRSTH